MVGDTEIQSGNCNRGLRLIYFWHVGRTNGLDSRQLLKTVECPKSDRKKNSFIKTIPEANLIFKTLSETYCYGLKTKPS